MRLPGRSSLLVRDRASVPGSGAEAKEEELTDRIGHLPGSFLRSLRHLIRYLWLSFLPSSHAWAAAGRSKGVEKKKKVTESTGLFRSEENYQEA